MTILPFKSINEAISISNSTRYGLGAAVFGEDARECQIVADKLEVGMVAVNECVLTPQYKEALPIASTRIC